MNYSTSITLLASSMDLGDTLRELCPRCEGGSTREKSLSITLTEDGQLLWQCFRANCTEKRGASGRKVIVSATAKPEKVRAKFEGTTKALSDYHLAQIKSMWGIEDPPYWYYTPDYGGRIAMSIRGPKYNHRGWVLRDIRGRAKTKALTYIEKDEESLSWYKTTTNAPTVLVEDIPSAVRANGGGVNAVALLGTAIGLGKALEIAANAPRPIIIALDQDATSKSFDYIKRYGLLWDTVLIRVLPKDLKDMTEEELKEILT